MEDTRKKTYTIAKDYTVSNETFGLYLDGNTGGGGNRSATKARLPTPFP